MRNKSENLDATYGFSLSSQEAAKEIASVVLNGLKK